MIFLTSKTTTSYDVVACNPIEGYIRVVIDDDMHDDLILRLACMIDPSLLRLAHTRVDAIFYDQGTQSKLA